MLLTVRFRATRLRSGSLVMPTVNRWGLLVMSVRLRLAVLTMSGCCGPRVSIFRIRSLSTCRRGLRRLRLLIVTWR